MSLFMYIDVVPMARSRRSPMGEVRNRERIFETLFEGSQNPLNGDAHIENIQFSAHRREYETNYDPPFPHTPAAVIPSENDAHYNTETIQPKFYLQLGQVLADQSPLPHIEQQIWDKLLPQFAEFTIVKRKDGRIMLLARGLGTQDHIGFTLFFDVPRLSEDYDKVPLSELSAEKFLGGESTLPSDAISDKDQLKVPVPASVEQNTTTDSSAATENKNFSGELDMIITGAEADPSEIDTGTNDNAEKPSEDATVPTESTQSTADSAHPDYPVHDLELLTTEECWERVPKGHGSPIPRYLREIASARKVTPQHKPPFSPFRPRSLSSSSIPPRMPAQSTHSPGPSTQAAQSTDNEQASTSTATCAKPPRPPLKPSCDNLTLWEWPVDTQGFQDASRLDNNSKVTVAYCVLREAMLHFMGHGGSDIKAWKLQFTKVNLDMDHDHPDQPNYNIMWITGYPRDLQEALINIRHNMEKTYLKHGPKWPTPAAHHNPHWDFRTIPDVYFYPGNGEDFQQLAVNTLRCFHCEDYNHTRRNCPQRIKELTVGKRQALSHNLCPTCLKPRHPDAICPYHLYSQRMADIKHRIRDQVGAGVTQDVINQIFQQHFGSHTPALMTDEQLRLLDHHWTDPELPIPIPPVYNRLRRRDSDDDDEIWD